MDAKLADKRWKKEFEQPIVEGWKKSKCYAFDETSDKPLFSIDTPPPYVNSPIHIGHATTYTLMDMFARFHRMKGFNVLFPLGLDRNGLPIEMAAEKKFKVRFTQLSREEALGYCEKILQETSATSTDSFLKLGISFNSWEEGTEPGDVYLTDSSDYRTLTQETFIDLWEKGLVYEADRANNWDPGLQTTIADSEIEYADLSSHFVDFSFKVKETGEDIVIGSTRPELLCACGMVIYHPDDARYQHLQGKTAITPIYNKEVPIIAHPAANSDKGTGIMMMCSFGDVMDIQFFREQKLSPIIAINKNGTMNAHAGFLAGLHVKKARLAIIEALEKCGLVVAKKDIVHRTPISERSKTPIEFITMPELYLKQVDFKQQMKELASQLQFHAPRSRQILLDWIDSVSIDWPISRRRFYGTEIPMWHGDGHVALPPRGVYVQPWKDMPPKESIVYDLNRKKLGTVADFPNVQWRGEERIFDTWFDSSNSPLHVLRYKRDDAFFAKAAPCTLRPQGKEIVRTWLYYTLLKCFLLTNKLIFRDAWIHFHVVDDTGKKMSKSKGNVLDPHDILDQYGAEPFRLWCAIEGNLDTTDFRCSFPRIDGAGKTIIKLWNVARFISLFPKPKHDETPGVLDTWMRGEVNRLVAEANEAYARYDFHSPVQTLKHFLWETFASHYLEMVKSRAYNTDRAFSQAEQDAAVSTLYYCLERLLLLLAPVIPMVTSRIYETLYGGDVHVQAFPQEETHDDVPFTTAALEELNRSIWKQQTEQGISLKAAIGKATIPAQFASIEKDLQATHNIREITYGDSVRIAV